MSASSMGVTSGVPPTSAEGNAASAEQASAAQAQEQAPGSEQGHEESVPYERFKTVLDELNGRKQWDPVLDKIRNEAGFQNPAEVLAFADQQAQAQANQKIQDRLQAQVDAGDISPDAAEAAYQRETRALQLERRLTVTEQRQQAAELEKARKEYPEMDEDAVLAKFARGKGTITALAKESHDKIEAKIAARSTSYQETKQEHAARPVPTRSGGGAPGKASIPNPVTDPAGWKAYHAKIESDLMRGV